MEKERKRHKAAAKKYGGNLQRISYHILNNMSDAEECVNDTYLRIWNSIPKARPASLLAYTGRILRNLSIDRLKKKMSNKKERDNFLLILSELDDCIASGESAETAVEYKKLSHDISVFLEKQKKRSRHLAYKYEGYKNWAEF